MEPTVATDVHDGDASLLQRRHDEQATVAAGRVLLGAHDSGRTAASEIFQALDASLEVGCPRAAGVIDVAIGVVELRALRSDPELAAEENVIEEL